MGFRNQFAHSESKLRMLEVCPRQLYYYVYASWNGWWSGRGGTQPPTNKHAAEAYAMKQADNVFTLSGRVVHAVAEEELRRALQTGGLSITLESLKKRMLSRAEAMLEIHIDQANRPWHNRNPKHTTVLTERVYGEPVDVPFIAARIRKSIEALCEAEWIGDLNVNVFYETITRASRRIKFIEELSMVSVSGIPAWITVDVALSGKEPGTAVVVDWKTGHEKEQDHRQIASYAGWAHEKGYTAGTTTILVYLDGPVARTVVKTMVVDPANHPLADSARKFVELMKPLLVNGDIDRNEPIPSRFVGTGSPSDCARCAWRGLCERDGTKPKPTQTMDDPF